MVNLIHQQFNKTFAPVFSTKARYIHLMGGRSRGGSHFGTDYFLHLVTQPKYFRGYLMRQVFGDIRESLWRDFNDRIQNNDTIDEKLFSFQDVSMTAQYIPTGNEIISKGFKKSSGNQTAKLKSIAGATHVLIEEGEETSEDEFMQLDDSLRTIMGDIQIIFIFNMPHKDHWIMKRWYNLVPVEEEEFKGYYRAIPKNDSSLLSIHTTYRDNIINVNETTIQNFHRYRITKPEYYATMIEGYVSEGMKGLIYKNWQPITSAEFDELPYEAFYGLDFGFSNDPAALIKIKTHNDDVWFKESLYEIGLTNPMLSKRFEALSMTSADEIIADSAEPKSIKELQDMGWNVIPAVKGEDSVRAGVSFLQGKNVHYTEDSSNLIVERQEYRWALDANKEPTDKPVDKKNHLMDGGRYGVYTKLNGFLFKPVAA